MHQEFNNISASLELSMDSTSELNSLQHHNEVLDSAEEVLDIEEVMEGNKKFNLFILVE